MMTGGQRTEAPAPPAIPLFDLRIEEEDLEAVVAPEPPPHAHATPPPAASDTTVLATASVLRLILIERTSFHRVP